ncbi:MAG: UDP-N-acetylmuramate dehydrogenase [Oscillospiraceae bacterium]|nr:UDP-N-acetylmuramate dehydrogenase [Oscillospiraceae bacterium]
MTTEQINKIKELAITYGFDCSENVPLSRYTTFGIGGCCPLMIEAGSEQGTAELVRKMTSQKLPFYIIGKGSNLLVEDGEIPMIFLHMGHGMSDISEEKGVITCQAGAALSAVSAFARDRGLTGLEFAYGIPGNIGGAVFMNAGAYGGEMKDVIESVTACDMQGFIREFSAEELDFGYRHSVFSGGGYVILSARLKLALGDKEAISERMAELTRMRKEKQPLEYRSAGSTFKRPQGAFAAQLIEECGLKGYSCGDAMVSEKHSGFVINKGNASFEDVMNVIRCVKETVYLKKGISLECEPEIIRRNTNL